MVSQDTLNGINLLQSFSLVIQTGTARLLEFPERKETLTNDWREENGSDYDLTNPKFKDKEVTLNCAILADNAAAFWNFYNSFWAEISKAGWQNLYIQDHDKTYQVFYRRSGSFQKLGKRLNNVPKVFVKFELTLQVKQ